MSSIAQRLSKKKCMTDVYRRKRWNKGGKLPGLRGGPENHGCSGGDATNGTTCFSTRLMWRSNGSGEGMRLLHCIFPATELVLTQSHSLRIHSHNSEELLQ